MENILLLLALFAFIVIIYKVAHRENTEKFDTLRSPGDLPANIYRVTNTILTATGTFYDEMDKLTLPSNVKDNFNEWIDKGFVSPIKDQMLCGGCWSFAVCGSLADRLAIATGGKWYAPFGLSEQLVISCGGDMGMDYYQGCDGGIPHFAIDALTKSGVPADSKCLQCSSSSGGGGQSGGGGGVVNPNNSSTCSTGNTYANTLYTWWQTGCDESTSCSLSAASTCPCSQISTEMKNVEDAKNTPFDVKYKTIGEAHNYTSHGDNDELKTVDLWPDIPQSIIDKNVDRMKKAIYYEGPITIGYRVTADFYTFWPTSASGNYYKYDGSSQMQGGHAVVIVGWKKMTDGTPVWIVKNSWGANGGYGFPNGPKWTDPISGKVVPKYIGGFWNHIMGINDSFIESNATGAHPDLSVPQIKELIGLDIPTDWYNTMTLRDIYQKTPITSVPSEEYPTPIPTHIPTPDPTPQITSENYTLITMTLNNVSPQSIKDFFKQSNNISIIGANNATNVKIILGLLPNDKTELEQSDITTLAEQVAEKISGNIAIAVRGSANNYYYISGDPKSWSIFSKNIVTRTATVKKLAHDLYYIVQGLAPQSPVVLVSS